jgi:tRNA nucleotidyltransferase (CCA-adding enzyme)
MDRLKVLRLLHPGLQLDGRDRRVLEDIEELLSEFGGLVRSGAIHPWLIYLNALLGRLDPEDAEHVLRHYRFRTSDCKKLLLDRTSSSRRLRDLARSRASDSDIWRALSGMPLEACLYLAARSRSERVRSNVGRYLRSLRFVEAPLSGEDLRGMGYPSGPLYREILDWLRDERLDGRIMTPRAAREAVLTRWPLPIPPG